MKTNKKGNMVACLALAATAWLVGAPAASAVTYTFRQGVNDYTGASTTYTEYQPSEAQSYNYGARRIMLVYSPDGDGAPKKTGFAMFDLSSVTAPVDVSSATLTLGIAGDGARGPGYSLTYNLYPILRAGLNFGSSDGASQNGAVSFNSAAFDPTSPIGWGLSNTGNYGPVAGEDYGTTSIGSFTLTDQNAAESFVNITLNPITVASWVNSPSTNYGFVIVADQGPGQAVIYTGSESGAIYRPQLSFEATAIPEPGSIALLGLGAVIAFTGRGMLRRRAPATA